MYEKKFKFIFLILIFLISCDPTQETKKVSYIKIEQAIQKTSFYINDQNNSQELFVLSYDQNDKLTGYSSVIWTSNLPDSTIISKTDSSFVFDVNSIGELGDYFIKAQSKNNAELKAEYVFSLISKNSLNDSLTYSYADLSSTQLTFTDDNKINIDQITEYDKNGNKINSSEQRMTLQDEINFTGTGMNFLYISLKDNVNLGKISTEISSENLDIFHTTDDGLIIGGITDDQSVSVTLSAGSKESKQITISPLVSFISLTAPVISDPVYSELYDGQLVTITGDSVDTAYYPVENGNNLEITVLRRKYNSSNEYQPYTYYKTNEETKEIKYGQVIHLKHAGDYIISARISNAVFSSEHVEKYISIAPKTISSSNLKITSHIPDEIVDSKLLWTDLQAGTAVPQDYFYKVYLKNNFDQGNLIVYINHIETNGQTEQQEYKLLSQETLSENYNKSGTYLITVKCENFLSGFGEILNEDIADDCAILSSFEIKDSEITDEILSITGDRIYTITASDSLPEHAVIYVALLKDDMYDSTFTFTAGEEHIIENTDNKCYKFKAYVYFNDNRASSIMYEYRTDIPTLLTSALPKITDSDDIQNARNQRRIQLNLTQDAYGNYRPTFYRWDDDPEWHEFDKTEIVYASTSEKGNHVLYIKVLPSQSESVTGEVITSCTLNLSKLPFPSAYIDYHYGMGGGFVRGYVCSTFQGATVEAQGYTNHKEGNVKNHWNYTEITQSTSFTKIFYDTGGYSWLFTHYWTESIYAYQYKNGYIDSGHIYVEYYGKDSIYEEFTND